MNLRWVCERIVSKLPWQDVLWSVNSIFPDSSNSNLLKLNCADTSLRPSILVNIRLWNFVLISEQKLTVSILWVALVSLLSLF